MDTDDEGLAAPPVAPTITQLSSPVGAAAAATAAAAAAASTGLQQPAGSGAQLQSASTTTAYASAASSASVSPTLTAPGAAVGASAGAGGINARPVRCVVVGDACGKTSLIKSFLFGRTAIPESHVATVLHMFEVAAPVVGDEPARLSIVEFGSGCNFDHIDERVHRADVFLVCFSVITAATFERARRKWIQEIRSLSRAPIVLCGTQVDLVRAASQRSFFDSASTVKPVTRDMAVSMLQAAADDRDTIPSVYVETSAFTGALYLRCGCGCSTHDCDVWMQERASICCSAPSCRLDIRARQGKVYRHWFASCRDACGDSGHHRKHQ
jgi:GTPase SAR1 family protein